MLCRWRGQPSGGGWGLRPASRELQSPKGAPGRTPPSSTPGYLPTVSAEQALSRASAGGFWAGGGEECLVGNTDTPGGHRNQVLPVNPRPHSQDLPTGFSQSLGGVACSEFGKLGFCTCNSWTLQVKILHMHLTYLPLKNYFIS